MVPYEWRRDPNAYQYFYKFAKARSDGSSAHNEEHVECVICMNKIIWEIDAEGSLINEQSLELATLSSSNRGSSVSHESQEAGNADIE